VLFVRELPPDSWGRELTRMVYNTGVMKLFDSWRLSNGASLVAVAAILCLLGALLHSSATGPEVPATLTTADSFQMGQGANGGEHPLNGSFFAVPGEEAEKDDKDPVDAGLLTALLFAFFFGMARGWPLAKGGGHQALCSSSGAPRLLFVPRRNSPSLGVLRL
jgi:hypothetical protein